MLLSIGQVSFDEFACIPSDNTKRWDWIEEEIKPIIELTEDAIKTIRTLTGRYLVAIQGMSLNDELPCEARYSRTSRWARQSSSTSCTAAAGALGSKTVDMFT